MPDMTSEEFAARAAALAGGQHAPLGGGELAPTQTPADTTSFAARAQAAAAGVQPQPATVAPPPTPEEVDASIQGFQREQKMKAFADYLMANPPTQEKPRTRNIAEATLAPVEAIGSAVGSAIRSAVGVDTNDPQNRAILGARPGVEFDPNEGVSFMSRLATQFTFNRAETAYALMAANPAVQDVHFNQLGEPVVTIKDKVTGKVKDVLANPVGMDWGDLAMVLANAPQMLAGGWAGAVGKEGAALAAPEAMRDLNAASRVMRQLIYSRSVSPTSARMALAGEAAGAATDYTARGLMEAGGDLPGGMSNAQLWERRGEGAVADFLFGGLTGVGTKAGSRVISPLSNRGPIQINADNAARLWEQAGVNYKPSVAERTGSPFFGRSEAFAEQKPGSAGVFAAFKADQKAALDQMWRIQLGTDPSVVPPADLVGQRALDAIGQALTPLDKLIDRTSSRLLDAVTDDIKADVAAATGVPDTVAQTAVGQALFKGTEARLADFNAAKGKLYDVVKQDPRVLGQGRNIDATPMATEAQALLDSMAAVEKPTPTGGTQTEQLTSVLTPNTVKVLNQLAGAKGGKIGYSDLIEARSDIGSALEGATAIGSIPEGRLKQVYGLLTSSIQNGLDSLDSSGGLRKAWEKANDFTREGMQRFKDVDILPLFKEGTQRGSLDLYDIVKRAVNDPGKWMAYRDFFGADSMEMKLLRRVNADRLLGRSIGTDMVDGSSFAKRLAAEYSDEGKRDILLDTFGGRIERLKGFADVAEAVSKGNVDVVDLAHHIENGTLTRKVMDSLLSMQASRDQVYRNQALKQMRDGNFQADPSKFVDTFVFGAKSEPADLREALSYLNPDQREEVVQRTLLRIMQESQAGMPGKERTRSSLLSDFTTDQNGNMIGTRVRDTIGPERFERLKAMEDLTLPADVSERAFRSAGGIAGGAAISKLESKFGGPGTVGALEGIAKSMLLASTYKWGPTRNWLANNFIGGPTSTIDRAALVNGFVSGAPVLENFASLLGAEHLRDGRILSLHIKNAIDADLRGDNQQKGK